MLRAASQFFLGYKQRVDSMVFDDNPSALKSLSSGAAIEPETYSIKRFVVRSVP